MNATSAQSRGGKPWCDAATRLVVSVSFCGQKQSKACLGEAVSFDFESKRSS